ncbi:MAG: RlmE family RNA methyltransferase [Euryhalocaulis sp.]|uniref:RlmE family RNA methyltransferase n=1 Tax=Euryhalocaulis sp. TaxID=2744307 RepID=UPI0017E20193|nr:RlmE family RNA methyltransferase [Euryhalocaulis sp.]MBA4800298.1 RlmE family RNA methyltransferase [Euryhalocaulis sp.]
MSDDEERRRRRSGPVKKGQPRRGLTKRVKTAKGRKSSSTRWLQRQLNDPYVEQARAMGYRSRAAFKLIELDDKFELIRKGMRVADLGAAPGGWTQVALERGASRVVGIDLLAIDPIPGAELLELDFTEEGADEAVKAALGGEADLVVSDLAPWTTGHKATDHLKIIALVEVAAHFAFDVLAPGGAFVAKVFQGGTEQELLKELRGRFEKVKHAKPDASRSESAEIYLVAQGFKG